MKPNEFETPESGWDITTMTQLFASDPPELGDVDVDVDNAVLFVTIKEKGGLVISMVRVNDQILASVLLVAANDVPRQAEFDKAALSLHKAIPLSTFGVTKVDGADWYEMFGSLSVNSTSHNLIEEVATLAENAADAAEWITEWKDKYDAFPTENEGEKA